MPIKMPKMARTAVAIAAGAALIPSNAAVVNWGLAGNGFWDVAGNWSPSAPGAADDVFITVAGLRTITFRSGTVGINSLTVTDNILDVTGGTLTVAGAYANSGSGTTRVSGGILTLNGPSSLGSLTQSQGSIAGTGTVTISGPAAFTFGDHRGSGTTVLQGASTISSSGFRLDGGRTLRNEGALTWTAGQLLFNNTFTGASGGAGSGSFLNAAGGTVTISGDGGASAGVSNFGGADTGADAVINNFGSFVKSGSGAANVTTLDVAFNNSGSLQVQTGTLNLTNGGTHSGSFAGGGTLGFGGGTHVVNAGSTIGTQNVAFSGSGSTTINGSYNVAGLTSVSGGTVSLAGTLTSLGSALTVSGGQLSLNASNASIATLTQSQGSVAGTGTLTVTGAAALTFGDHRGTGTTVLQGNSTISSSGFRLDGGRTLRNEGTVTWSSGQLLFNNTFSGASGGAGSGTIVNALGSTFIANGDSSTSMAASNFGGTDTGADAVFNNLGTFRKAGSSGTHTTTVDVAFNNTGAVQVQTGVLNLTAGGTHAGSFSGAGTIGFGGGTHVVTAAGSVATQNVNFGGSGNTTIDGSYNVPGRTAINAGTATINGTLASLGNSLEISGGLLAINASNATVGTLTQSQGGLSGTGTVTFTNGATITFGDHRGTGTTVLQGNSTIASSGFRLDGGRTLRNEGTITWTGGQILFNNTFSGASGGAGSGTFVNLAGSTLIASGNSATGIAASNFGGTDTGADALFTNAGLFRKTGSGSTITTSVDVTFNNSGAVEVQSGILNLTGGGTHTGSFDVAAGTVLGFGGGTHALNGGGITSPGTVRVSAGAVNVNTAYSIAGTTEIQNGFLNLLGGNATTGSLLQSSGSVAGNGNLTVTGLANLTFGDHRGSGTTILQGATTISGSGFRLDGGRTLRNEGTVTWTAGGLLFNNTFTGASGGAGSGTILNAADANFIVSGNSSTSVSTSNFGGTDTGADAAFNNAGSFQKTASTAASTTTVDVAFNNSGTVRAETGFLNLTAGGIHTGNFDVAAGAVLGFGGGTHTVNAGTITSPGTLRIGGSATVNVNTGYSIAGTTEIQSGFLNLLGGNATTGSLVQSNGSVTGASNLTVTGLANLSFGDHRGAGTTILQGATTITGSGFRLDGGRTLRNEGTVTWTAGGLLFNNTFTGASGGAGSGTLLNAAGATFVASGNAAGSMSASSFGVGDTGADALFDNAGTFRKSGSNATDTTTVSINYVNTGTTHVQTGVLNLADRSTQSGAIQIDGGATLRLTGNTHTFNTATTSIAGALEHSAQSLQFNAPHTITGSGSFTQTTGSVQGANLTIASNAGLTFGDHRGPGTTTLQANTTISGSGLRLDGGRTLRNEGTLTWTGGGLLFNNTFTGAAGGAGSGTIHNAVGATFLVSGDAATSISASNFGAGDSGADAVIQNAGSFRKNGSSGASNTNVGVAFTNSGTVQASTGTLTFAQGVTGPAGTIRIDPGASVVLQAPSTVGTLVHGGTGPFTLNLGANTITVSTDYDNASFGSGNAFNRRANVATTGAGVRIVAAGDANQGVAGVGVSNGNSATPGLVIGNVHVGATTYTYQIVNTGSTGPALRGAIQTAANGASLTDARLSGSGVTAGTWGALATGDSLSRDVVLTVTTAGVFAPLSGQTVSIVNNFDNTRSQLLTIGSSAGAAAYNLAAAAPLAPSPVLVANQRVGGAELAALTIANSAPPGSFTEGLNASFGPLTGDVFSNGGSIVRLAGGSSTNALMAVGVDTSTAGAKSGTATVAFASDGTGSSGLGITALASQTVNVSGNVFRPAAAGAVTPNPVTIGNVRVGSTATQNLTVTNTAANDGFSERLNASIAAGGGGVVASGSITQLAAQATNSTGLTVGLDTATAGAKAGTATISFASDGTGTSGLTPLALASQTVNISGAVYRLANPVLQTPAVTLVARVGDVAPSASVGLVNSSPDAFTERLNAGFGTVSASFVGNGSVTGLAAGASSSAMTVSLDTAAGGNRSGTAALTLVSSGAGTTGAPDLALPGQSVALTGRVYTPAVAQVNTTTVDFGIVHRGDVIGTRAVSVSNAAAVTAPNDTLRGTIATGSTPFSATGTVNDLAAGATSANAFAIGLDTSQAGVFTGSATASFTSHNSELADLGLGSSAVTLLAQINNFAQVALSQAAGSAGTFGGTGPTFTLDFGTILQGSGTLTGVLRLANGAVGPADLLAGSFDLSALGAGFSLAGFGDFSGLAAGSSRDLTIVFADAVEGSFESSILLHAEGRNASGFIGGLADTTLVLRGVVAVPEPSTWLLIFSGLVIVLRTASARLRAREEVRSV